MSNPTRNSLDANMYREVTYFGGRILQASELQFMEDLRGDSANNWATRHRFELGGLFNNGSTMNVAVSIASGMVTLSPVDSSQPMLVFVNGAFEAFTAAPVTFSTASDGTTVYIYINYVLWRVSSDGHDATLTDVTLVDSTTGEATAEMGQLQVYVKTDGSDDSGVVDPLLMLPLGRNTAPIPMVTLQWNAGVLTLVSLAGPRQQTQATSARLGMVKTTGSSTVAGTDDSRLADARVPLDGSVTSAKLLPVAVDPTTPYAVPFTDETGTVGTLPIAKSTGGVDASKVLFSTWGATVAASLSFIWSAVLRAFAAINVQRLRIDALSGVTPVDLTTHIGQNIGGTTDQSTHTHPGVCNGPFTAVGAIQVLSGSTVQGEIPADGNYVLHNHDADVTTSTHGNIVLNDFLTMAESVKGLLDAPAGVPSSLSGDVTGDANHTLIATIKGRSISGLPDASSSHSGVQMVVLSGDSYALAAVPSGGSGSVTLAGDVSGASGTCTVDKIKGKPVSATAPTEGQTLKFTSGVWVPASAAGASATGAGGTGSNGNTAWVILNFGGKRVAFGTGQYQDGMQINVPCDGWNGTHGVANSWGQYNTFTVGFCTFSLAAGWVYQAYVGSGNRVSINVFGGGTVAAANAIKAGMFVSISIVAVED